MFNLKITEHIFNFNIILERLGVEENKYMNAVECSLSIIYIYSSSKSTASSKSLMYEKKILLIFLEQYPGFFLKNSIFEFF